MIDLFQVASVGVVLGHGSNAADWKGRLATDLAITLASQGRAALVNSLPGSILDSPQKAICSILSVTNYRCREEEVPSLWLGPGLLQGLCSVQQLSILQAMLFADINANRRSSADRRCLRRHLMPAQLRPMASPSVTGSLPVILSQALHCCGCHGNNDIILRIALAAYTSRNR